MDAKFLFICYSTATSWSSERRFSMARRGLESNDYYGGKKTDIVELKLLNDYVARPRGLDKGVNLELIAKGFLKNNRKGVVMMYNPSCPACEAIKIPYAEVAKKVKDSLFVGSLNCMDLLHQNDLLADYYKVNATPTIKFFNGNDMFYDYTGGPVTNEIMAWVLKMNEICKEVPKTSVYVDINKTGGAKSRKPRSKSKPRAKKA